MIETVPRDMIRTERARIRGEMRAKRRSIDGKARREASVNLARHLDRLAIFGPRRRVAFYLASDGEIDPSIAMREARLSGASCYVPVLPGRGRRVLRFARIGEDTRLEPNRFGILEPCVSPRALLRVIELDTVLLPLVAFDRTGNRLGMGGGYYDATLETRSAYRCFRRPRLVGVAYECQCLDQLAVAPWDVPLGCVATDRQVHVF
jgi:5-formyltetrahydrofolate cyclo-ligase